MGGNTLGRGGAFVGQQGQAGVMGGVSTAGAMVGTGAGSIASSNIEAAGRAAAVADGVIRSGE